MGQKIYQYYNDNPPIEVIDPEFSGVLRVPTIDVDNISIHELIYDSADSPGANGSFLSRDANGVRWVSFEPSFTEGIFIQDEGKFIPLVGAAQSFSTLNFVQNNSLGIGTDTLIPIPDPASPGFVAKIQTQDLWGFNSLGDIYRMTNVGIGSTIPTNTLDIFGTLKVSNAVTFNNTLGVNGQTTLNGFLYVNSSSYISAGLVVGGATTIGGFLNANSSANISGGLNVGSATTIGGFLSVNASASISGALNVGSATTIGGFLNVNNSADILKSLTIGENLSVAGITTLNNTLQVDGATNLNSSLDVDAQTTLNSDLDVFGHTTLHDILNVNKQTTLNDLNVLGVSTFVGVTTTVSDLSVGRNFQVAGVSTFVGNVTFKGGTINLGDENTDNVIFTADVNSDIIPNLNEAYNLGSPTQKWKDLYVGFVSFTNLYVSGVSTFVGITTNLSTLFANQLSVAGITTLQDRLNVNGSTNLNNTLNVVGVTTLQNRLNVNGAVGLNSTLNVVGITTLQDRLNVNGSTNLNNTLNVVGVTTLQDRLNVNGSTNLNNTLNVVGVTTLQDRLNVSGSTNLSSTLNVVGVTTLQDRLNVNGAVGLNSTLNVVGITTLQDRLNVSGSTNLNSTLNVVGVTTLQDRLNVNGPIDANSTLDVLGATTLQNYLDVYGRTSLNNTLNVVGVTTLQDELNVDGPIDANSTLDVLGATTLQNYLDVYGRTSLNNTLNVVGVTTLQDELNVDGPAKLNSTLEVGVGGTILTTTQDGLVGFGSTVPTREVDFQKDVRFQQAIYDTNDNVGFRSEHYQVPRNVLTTVGVDTSGSIIGGRFYDAANLIRLNLDFIANEAVGFLTSTYYKNPAFVIPTGNPKDCRDDIKDILKAITYDITRGGNSKSVGAGLSYYSGNTLQHITGNDINGYSIKDATIVAITTAAQIARYVINNLPPPISYQGIGSVPLIKDLTLQEDSNVGFNTDPDGCSNVVSAITVCAGIVTTIIKNGPSASPNVTTPDGKIIWAPAGADSRNIIYVSKYGNDDNNGRTEGAAKLTVAAAAEVAYPGDTIMVRSGVYYENNPIGLRTDVSISGQDLRLVTIIPNNPTKDVFHVRRGCLIENLNFSGANVSVAHTGAGAVAFPPTEADVIAGIAHSSVSGYLNYGPVTEGPSGRWRSPYVRNCTNFMTKSIGLKVDGNYASATNPNSGADLKSMVVDSFTQYNQGGIGVSITNNGYAQLVSIFTINCDIAIYCDSGGACDLTNSNSSFGNYGLYAVGLGATEYTATVGTYPPTRNQPGADALSDKITVTNIQDIYNNPQRPYDGQAAYFTIDLNNYGDVVTTGLSTTVLTEPLKRVKEIKILNGGFGFSPLSPPTVIIIDADDLTQNPKGPQGIIAEVNPTIDEITGTITSIDVINSGRNYLPSQNLQVFIDGGDLVGAAATVITEPIYFSVDSATEPTSSGITTVTFSEFIPYELFGSEEVAFKRISRILTSGHSFEYIGTGVDINTSTPFQGATPIKDNEVVALDGAKIPFTSTDQKGNFDIGEGFQINQPTASIRGRDFSKSIQAEVTPLILALR